MAEKRRTTKKVVKVEVDREAVAEEAKESGQEWTPTAEAKGSATGLRVGAWVFWALALVGEGLAIYWLLWLEPFKPTAEAPWYRDSSIALYVLIGMLVGIGLLAVAGSQLWKKANRLDPAKRSEPFRFFVQNQLGAIVTMVAFIPLIVLIFMNKDMDGKQKGIAGAVGIGVLVVAALLGISWNPPAVEDHPVNEAEVVAYTDIVEELTGADAVTWTEGGSVYHLCTEASAVNRPSSDPDAAIYTGTVETAHADGKVGLTKEVTEELGQCGLPEPANLDEIEAEVDVLRAESEAAPAAG